MARLGTILMERFPKLYVLESNKDCSIRDPDVCMWTTGGDACGNDMLSLIQKGYHIVIAFILIALVVFAYVLVILVSSIILVFVVIMAGNTVKDMTTNFEKLDKFEGHDFRRWQMKMHFLLTTLKVAYVLTTSIPELMEDATVEAIRIRTKWENNDYICRGHMLHGMSNSLFDVYTNVESTKELWDSLESKYMAEDSSSKKFLVNNFNNYKMADSRPVMKQYNELLKILGQYTQHGLKMNESISVSSIIDKFPPSWKDFKHTLKHGKDDLSLVQLDSHLRIDDSK
nr:zinc finger, CCHC-type [Tanacetum cinerariifolium]